MKTTILTGLLLSLPAAALALPAGDGAPHPFETDELREPRTATGGSCLIQGVTIHSAVEPAFEGSVIVRDGEPLWRHVGTARLTMRPFTDAFLDDYLDRAGEAVFTTVGAYQLEGLGAQLFSRVDGDYFAVLGLPLLEILGFLRARGRLIE